MKKQVIEEVSVIVEVEGVNVLVKRVANTRNGAPRWQCTVLGSTLGYTTTITTYEGERAAATTALHNIEHELAK